MLIPTIRFGLAKILVEFGEDHKALEVKAGIVDGDFADLATLTSLAKLPSREVLLGRMLGSMQSSLYSFVRVIDAIKNKLEAGEPLEAAAPAEEAPAVEEAPAEAPVEEAAPAEETPERSIRISLDRVLKLNLKKKYEVY